MQLTAQGCEEIAEKLCTTSAHAASALMTVKAHVMGAKSYKATSTCRRAMRSSYSSHRCKRQLVRASRCCIVCSATSSWSTCWASSKVSARLQRCNAACSSCSSRAMRACSALCVAALDLAACKLAGLRLQMPHHTKRNRRRYSGNSQASDQFSTNPSIVSVL